MDISACSAARKVSFECIALSLHGENLNYRGFVSATRFQVAPLFSVRMAILLELHSVK
jgi:hypothetical protein